MRISVTLAGIKQGKYGIEVASCDKVRALELLGRHLGMFKDKVVLAVTIRTLYGQVGTVFYQNALRAFISFIVSRVAQYQ